MGQKIKLGDVEYEVENLNDQTKALISYMTFSTERLKELINMQALLRRAKVSYMDSLKKEMLSSKAGLNFDEN